MAQTPKMKSMISEQQKKIKKVQDVIKETTAKKSATLKRMKENPKNGKSQIDSMKRSYDESLFRYRKILEIEKKTLKSMKAMK